MRLSIVSKDRHHEHVLVGALNPCNRPRILFLVAGAAVVAVHGAERDQGGRPRCAGERAWVGDSS